VAVFLLPAPLRVRAAVLLLPFLLQDSPLVELMGCKTPCLKRMAGCLASARSAVREFCSGRESKEASRGRGREAPAYMCLKSLVRIILGLSWAHACDTLLFTSHKIQLCRGGGLRDLQCALLISSLTLCVTSASAGAAGHSQD
jgi:hypothetical protein